MYDPYAGFTKHKLSNDLEVHTQYWERDWIRLEAVVHAGSREDPIHLPGIAHMLEHLLSENIPDKTKEDVRRVFEATGGSVDFGCTHYLSTRFNFFAPADIAIFKKALDMFGSMLLSAKIENEIEREKKVVHQEYKNHYPFPEKLRWKEEMLHSVFVGHRLENWGLPIGKPEGFLSATESDFQNFYDEYYTPSNISLVVLGGISEETVLKSITDSPFNLQKVGLRNPVPPHFNPPTLPRINLQKLKISDYISFKAETTEFSAIWTLPAAYSPETIEVFGVLMRKLLFSEIREKNALTYQFKANYNWYQDLMDFRIAGNVHSEATDNIEEVVRGCISKVETSSDLFKQALQKKIQKCLMTDVSGGSLVEFSADDLQDYQRIRTLQEISDSYKQVTFDEMLEIASYLSPERQFTMIVHP